MISSAAPVRRHGLAVAADVVIAPRAAFTSLREHTHWGWAFLLICLLGMGGSYLTIPIQQTVIANTGAHDQSGASSSLSPEQRRALAKVAGVVPVVSTVLYPLIVMVAILVVTLLFLAANALGGGDANFATLFGLATNIALISYGIYQVLFAAITLIRGPGAFMTQQDLLTAIPSLATFAGGNHKLVPLLAGLGPLQLWSATLIYFGLRTTARVSSAAAATTAIVVLLVQAILGASFAK